MAICHGWVTNCQNVSKIICWVFELFPQCVARVPVSLWGCGGRAVFAGRCVYVRKRSQPLATVSNRSREGRMAVPMVSFAKGVTFGAFQRGVASFCLAGVAIRDIPTCCKTSYVFLCGGLNTSATFSDDASHFSWQAQHFEDLRCHFAWQVQHFRPVVWGVSCESQCQRGADKVQIPWQRCHFVTGDEKWLKHPHRFWGRLTLYTPPFTLYTPHFTL